MEKAELRKDPFPWKEPIAGLPFGLPDVFWSWLRRTSLGDLGLDAPLGASLYSSINSFTSMRARWEEGWGTGRRLSHELALQAEGWGTQGSGGLPMPAGQAWTTGRVEAGDQGAVDSSRSCYDQRSQLPLSSRHARQVGVWVLYWLNLLNFIFSREAGKIKLYMTCEQTNQINFMLPG